MMKTGITVLLHIYSPTHPLLLKFLMEQSVFLLLHLILFLQKRNFNLSFSTLKVVNLC